jgi:anti-sigma regulatory factor (Ser/Thr protein kinase)
MNPAISAQLPGRPESAATARALVRQILGENHPSTGDAMVIVSELVGNAVAHTRSGQPGGTVTVAVELSAQPPAVCIRVDDAGGPTVPVPAAATPGDEHGRGLGIVAALAAEWGTEHSETGTATWCRLTEGETPTVMTANHSRHRDPALPRRHADGAMTSPITGTATGARLWLSTHGPGSDCSSRTAGCASKRGTTTGERKDMTDMKQPQNEDADHPLAGYRPPTWAVVTWVNEQLRDRIQRNGPALAEILQAGDRQLPERSADPQPEDREAEP